MTAPHLTILTCAPLPAPTAISWPRSYLTHPLRVLYVEGNIDGTIGGSFYSLLFLVKGLDKSRYVPIVVFSTANELIAKFEAAGARVIIRPLARPVRLTWSGGRWFARAANFWLGWIGEPLRLARLLRRERVALVHLNNSILRNHPWMVAARLCRLPCVTHERGINPRYTLTARSLGRGLAAVICISTAVRDNFAAVGVRALRLVTIPNGLDPNEMAVTKSPAAILGQEFALASATPVVGIVGNIRRWKGQHVVIRAMGLLQATVPGAVCLIIGPYSEDERDYRDEIVRLIAELKLEGRVIVTGYRPNVADYVNAVQVLVHASVSPEPFGRVLLEGMALAKPIAASRGGAVPEIVDDGVTGLLFTPGNSVELAQALSTLLRDADLRATLGRAGYQRLVRQFGIDTNVAKTQELYANILTGVPA